MKKHNIYNLVLSAFFFLIQLTANAEGLDDQIIILSPNNDQVVTENSGSITKKDSSIIVNNNTTEIDSTQDKPTEESDILFVQKIHPVVSINRWMLLIQSKNKDYDKIESKLKEGQDINANVMEGNTMLILGAMQNNIEEVKFALKHKANIYIKNNEGDTALHWAASTGNSDMVQLILDSMAKTKKSIDYINDKDNLGRSPLHFAAMYKPNIKTIEILLKNKANINSVDINGQTPAHFAGAYEQWKNFEVLIKNGCNLSIKDNNNIIAEYFILTHSTIEIMNHFYPYLTNEGQQQITHINGYKSIN